eukprot:COSAG01_NODE_7865_length_3019_cov_6.573288_3_plen_116_part_00
MDSEIVRAQGNLYHIDATRVLSACILRVSGGGGGGVESARVQAFSQELCHFLAELAVSHSDGVMTPWRLAGKLVCRCVHGFATSTSGVWQEINTGGGTLHSCGRMGDGARHCWRV